MEGKNDLSLPRWDNLAFTFSKAQTNAEHHLIFCISVETKPKPLVNFDSAYEAVNDRMMMS